MAKQVIGFAQRKVTIDGTEYTIQKIPFRSYLEMEDRCTSRSGILQKSSYLSELFKHCVVSPKVTLEAFDENFGAASELAGEIESFLKSKADKGTDTEES
jgi:hypothetical protein